MALPYELLIGLRYTRAKKHNHFISFISLISMLGIALGVAALIVVLSVMNGFQTELRSRILAVVSHVQISGVGGEWSTGKRVPSRPPAQPHVVAAAPFVQAQAMLAYGQAVRGAWCAASCPIRKTRSPIFART
jgi:lipoprotein-releasing system permease protein